MMGNTCKEAVMIRFQILSLHLLGSTEKYHKNTQTRELVSGLRSRHLAFHLQIRSITHLKVKFGLGLLFQCKHYSPNWL